MRNKRRFSCRFGMNRLIDRWFQFDTRFGIARLRIPGLCFGRFRLRLIFRVLVLVELQQIAKGPQRGAPFFHRFGDRNQRLWFGLGSRMSMLKLLTSTLAAILLLS